MTLSTGLQLCKTQADNSYVNKVWENTAENIKISVEEITGAAKTMFYEVPLGWSRSKYKETQMFMSCDPCAE